MTCVPNIFMANPRPDCQVYSPAVVGRYHSSTEHRVAHGEFDVFMWKTITLIALIHIERSEQPSSPLHEYRWKNLVKWYSWRFSFLFFF